MKKIIIATIVTIIIILVTLLGIFLIPKEEPIEPIPLPNENLQVQPTIKNEDIKIVDVDNKKTNYTFTYRNETFIATYIPDNWNIKDSYKITNYNDIVIICEELIKVHKVHGSDMKSYRTATDMAYEWLQHNIAYSLLPEGNSFKQNAKDVDLDPKDQNKTLKEMYEERTGKEFKIEDFLK